MKTLIIGAKGMLGQAFLKKLGTEFDIIAWDKEDLDITDQTQVNHKVTGINPDIIINCVAYNDVDGAEDNKDTANLINGRAVKFLAQAAQAKLLIHFSTDYVFKGDKENGYQETDLPDPISVYGASKLLGEQMLQEYSKNFYICRVSRLFGPPGVSRMAKLSFIDKILEVAAEKDELKVVDEEYSCPTYVNDVVFKIKDMIFEKKQSGIYHTANQGSCTWFELARQALEIKGLSERVKLIPVAADEFPRKAKRPRYSELISTKIKPLRNWSDALLDYLT